MIKKIHWLIKYYFFAFLFIFGTAFYLRTLEPKVNWTLYPSNTEIIMKNAIEEENCEALIKYYQKELETNFKRDIFGFVVRKDGRSIKGLNLLSYLKYNLNNKNCI